MASSTSSFRSNLKYTLIWLVAISGIYSAFLHLPVFDAGGCVGNTDFQNAVIRGQRYLYDLKNPDIVMVGASLTVRIRAREMGPSVFSVAWPYLSGLTALRTVVKKPEKPRTVILQVHQLLAEEPALEEILFNPVFFEARKHIRSLRQEFRPINIIKFLLIDAQNVTQVPDWFLPQRVNFKNGLLLANSQEESRASFERARLEKVEPTKPMNQKIRVWLSHIILDHYEEFFEAKESGFVEKPLYQSRLTALKEMIADLQSHGTKVVLNQVPMGPEVEAMPMYQHFVANVKHEFNQLEYIHITSPEFQFIDGLHMEDRTAFLYTEKLMSYLGIVL